jgi:multimeric flavodoxin WrbA
MRILALVSSYRKNGNTAGFVRMIESQIKTIAAREDEPLEFDTLYLGHVDIELCRGCRTCFDRGEEMCPLKDDVPVIKARMDAADGMILASPVYVNDVNGIAKNWIDRLAYVCHRPQFAGKCVYLLATVAGGPTSHTLRTMSTALLTWGCHIVGQAGYRMGALMAQEERQSRFQEEAAQIARALFEAIAQEHFLKPSFLSLMTFKIQRLSWQQETPGSLDYEYWREQGWFDPDRTFYIQHRASRLRVALARLTGAVLARFVA